MNILSVTLAIFLTPAVGPSHTGTTAAERTTLNQFLRAKLGLQRPDLASGQLEILKHFDIVWQNCRVDRPLTLGTREYRRGLFTHAPSDIRVRLPGPARTFSAIIGVDSNSQTRGGQGSVVFSIARDGETELFHSEVLREGRTGVPIRVDLSGVTEFHMQVGDGGDGVNCDQAIWIDPVVTLMDGHEIHLSDLPIVNAPWATSCSSDLPFSFTYGEKRFAEIVSRFSQRVSTRELDANRMEYLSGFPSMAPE